MAEYDINNNQSDEGVEIPVEFEEDTATEPEQDAAPQEDAEETQTAQDSEAEDAGAAETEPSAEEVSEAEPAEEQTGEQPCEEEAGEHEESEEECCCEEEAAESGSECEEKAGKTGWFARKKNKEKEKFEQQIADLTDLLRRNRAEFDNFRKRTEKEKANMYRIGARDIVEKILPVVDSFERGLSQAQEGDPFAEGMQLIYKQLMTALEELGVKPIEAVGKPFDPDFHNAVMHVDDEEAPEDTVVEEFQKGYTYKDSVVRHSMVKVAN